MISSPKHKVALPLRNRHDVKLLIICCTLPLADFKQIQNEFVAGHDSICQPSKSGALVLAQRRGR